MIETIKLSPQTPGAAAIAQMRYRSATIGSIYVVLAQFSADVRQTGLEHLRRIAERFFESYFTGERPPAVAREGTCERAQLKAMENGRVTKY
jgi:hypothetical protein